MKATIILLSMFILRAVHVNAQIAYPESDEGTYVTISVNPILDGAPHKSANGNYIDLDASEFLTHAQGGLGHKFGDWRVEGRGVWSQLDINGLAELGSGDGKVTNLGLLGGLYRDWDLAGHGFDDAYIYVGSAVGAIRSSLRPADMLSDPNDWATAVTVDGGLILELNDSTNVNMGYQYMQVLNANFGSDEVSYGKHIGVIGLNFYRRR